MNPFLANSKVNRLVIFSSSCSEYSLGLILIPALAPPKGTSTHAHLNVIKADKAFTSSLVTSVENRIPVERKKKYLIDYNLKILLDFFCFQPVLSYLY